MPDSVIVRLLSFFGRDTDGEGTTDVTDGDGASSDAHAPSSEERDADEEGFLRSRLDASVLFAHGKRSRQAQDAIDDVQARAEELEAADGDRDPPDH